MTKQQIVAQLVTAKFSCLGILPGDHDLESYGKLADKIIEMFPEPEITNIQQIIVNGVDGSQKENIRA